jgi:hypothetical protein
VLPLLVLHGVYRVKFNFTNIREILCLLERLQTSEKCRICYLVLVRQLGRPRRRCGGHNNVVLKMVRGSPLH